MFTVKIIISNDFVEQITENQTLIYVENSFPSISLHSLNKPENGKHIKENILVEMYSFNIELILLYVSSDIIRWNVD